MGIVFSILDLMTKVAPFLFAYTVKQILSKWHFHSKMLKDVMMAFMLVNHCVIELSFRFLHLHFFNFNVNYID